jgi:hypothetical protein
MLSHILHFLGKPSENTVEALDNDAAPVGKSHVVVTPSGKGQETVRIDASLATTDYFQGCPVEQLNIKSVIHFLLYKHTQGITKMVGQT